MDAKAVLRASIRTIRVVALAVLVFAAGATPQGQGLADLMAAATSAGEVLAFENDYVRVRYAVLEYPAAERAVAESRPVGHDIPLGRLGRGVEPRSAAADGSPGGRRVLVRGSNADHGPLRPPRGCGDCAAVSPPPGQYALAVAGRPF
jgi:hypothetical protein